MKLRRVKSEELNAVNKLLAQHGINPIGSEFLNKRDISIGAYDGDKLVGFIWAGLMASDTVAYIDVFTIDPAYANKQLGEKLGNKLRHVVEKKKVNRIFGVIADTGTGIASCKSAIRIGLKPSELKYYIVQDYKE